MSTLSDGDAMADVATELDRLRLFVSSVTDYAICMLSPVNKDQGNPDGFNFLPKPYRMADLVKMLRSIG